MNCTIMELSLSALWCSTMGTGVTSLANQSPLLSSVRSGRAVDLGPSTPLLRTDLDSLQCLLNPPSPSSLTTEIPEATIKTFLQSPASLSWHKICSPFNSFPNFCWIEEILQEQSQAHPFRKILMITPTKSRFGHVLSWENEMGIMGISVCHC